MMRPTETLLALLLALSLVACGGEDAKASEDPPDQGDQRGLVLLPPTVAPKVVEGMPDRPNFHSFGEVADGSLAKHTFLLRNAESVPVSITGIHPGCGCTAAGVRVTTESGQVLVGAEPEQTGDPWIVVPPSAEVELTLSVDTRDIASKNKDRTLTTRVVTDSEVGRYLTFELHVFVAQDLQVNPKRLDIGEIPVGEGGAGTVDVVPIGDRGAELVGVRSSPDGVRVEVVPTNLMGHAAWQVQASVSPPLELGALYGIIRLETRRADGEEGHDLEIPFLARIVEDLRAEPSRLVLIDRGGDEELLARSTVSSLRPGERLVISAFELEGEGAEHFELTVVPVEPDARGRSHHWTVELRPRGTWPGEAVQRGEAVLTLERSQQSELRLPWVWHPRR